MLTYMTTLTIVRARPDVILYFIRPPSNFSASSTKGIAIIHSQNNMQVFRSRRQLQVTVPPHVVVLDHPHQSEMKAGCRLNRTSGLPRTSARAAQFFTYFTVMNWHSWPHSEENSCFDLNLYLYYESPINYRYKFRSSQKSNTTISAFFCKDPGRYYHPFPGGGGSMRLLMPQAAPTTQELV